jgi:hypothetical protein
MTKYVFVCKNGDVEQKITKTQIEDEKIFKLCNYKNPSGFEKLHCFPLNKNDTENGYEVYGKKSGRANSENKYEFPPPIDTELYFGSLCILKREDENITDLTLDEWSSVYESLFGGFEDIEDSDEERSVDSEVYSSDEYTKEGYHKDSFIIDDDELVEEEYE